MQRLEKPTRMTVEEYLAFEEASPYRHEYVDGIVYPMSDDVPVKKSKRHNIIKGNVFSILRNVLPAKLVVITGAATMKTQVPYTETFRYPDVLVCDLDLPDDCRVCSHPYFVAEIVTPKTEQYDRFEAKRAYRQFGSLNEYMLLLDHTLTIELYRRRNDWQMETYGLGDTVTIETFNVTTPVQEIYRNIKWS